MGEGTASAQPRETLPTSGRVLHELMLLRQRQGMTMQKLKGFPNLCSLPMVTEECARRGLSDTEDRHVAAFYVLQCAVRALIARTDYARILSDTLNFNARKLTNLEDRRAAIRASLYLTTKEYMPREQEAYEHFAGLLIAEQQTPCAHEMSSDEADRGTVELRIVATADQVADILNLLSLERRLVVRESLSSLLLATYSNARNTLQEMERETDDASAYFRFTRLLRGVLTHRWEVEDDSLTRIWLPSSVDAVLTEEVEGHEATHAKVADEEQLRTINQNQQLRNGIYFMPTFFSSKRATLIKLAVEFESLERKDQWREVLGDIEIEADVPAFEPDDV